MKQVLLLGLLPEVVDFTSMPGLTAEKLSMSLAAQEKALQDLGFDAAWCCFNTSPDDTREAVLRWVSA